MYPHTHFLFAFLIGELFVKLGFLTHKLALITGLLAILIDLDHYFEYIILRKDFNIKHFWNYTVILRDHRERTWLHHTPGFILFIIIPVILYFFSIPAMLVVIIAYWSHMLLDYVKIKLLHHITRLKEWGYNIPIYTFELVLDIALIAGIVILLIQSHLFS